jgi:hypothetical protein
MAHPGLDTRRRARIGSDSMNYRNLVLCAALCLTACFRATIRSSAGEVLTRDEQTSHGVSWLWGLTPVNARAPECQSGVAYAETQVPFWGILVYALTAGIVGPMSITYTCARGAGVEAMPGR